MPIPINPEAVGTAKFRARFAAQSLPWLGNPGGIIAVGGVAIRPWADDPCLIWMGSIGGGGYGLVGVDGRKLMAHRVARVMSTGEDIPDGEMIDHECYVRCCVNPAHLTTTDSYGNCVNRQFQPVRRTIAYTCDCLSLEQCKSPAADRGYGRRCTIARRTHGRRTRNSWDEAARLIQAVTRRAHEGV